MTILDWVISTFSTTGLITLLAWLFRQIILTRLKASVQHEFDEKLETLRADLRKSEESFKADLRAKETEIDALRSGALSGLASRQAALDKRRLEAVDQLWASTIALGPFKMATSLMAGVQFDKALELAAQHQNVRDFFGTLGASFDPLKFTTADAQKARPFVSEISWALFAAYHAIIGHAVVQLQMLKLGLKSADLLDTKIVTKLVTAALPQHTAYLEKYGPNGYYYMIEPLEAELLQELRRMMRGEESDKATVEQAKRIMEEVATVNTAISRSSTI